MSSEEEEYYYRSRNPHRFDNPESYEDPRQSNRPRRRNSATSRRRANRTSQAHSQKARRQKSWYRNHAARLMAIFVFLSLVGYEVFILKPPLFTDAFEPPTHAKPLSPSQAVSPHAQTPTNPELPASASQQNAQPGKPHAPDEPNALPATPPQPLHAPAEPLNAHAPLVRPAADVPADADADTGPAKQLAPTPSPLPTSAESFHQLKRRAFKMNSSASKPIHKLPASALRLNVSGTNGKVTVETGNAVKVTPFEKTKSAVDGDAASSQDSEMASHSANATDENKGADPGAGENFWNWFQETKGSEKEVVSAAIKCPEESSKRLCTMFYKYVRKYKIRSIYDISCVKNLSWMPEILKKVGGELWGFKYHCSAPDDDGMSTAKEKLASFGFVEFVDDPWWRKGFPQNPELLFAWDTLPHIAYGRVWNFFVKAKTQKIKFILVDNYPALANDPSPKREYINLRRHPFRFPAAKEVVQNVTEPGDTEKRQLLFYESSMLPENLQ